MLNKNWTLIHMYCILLSRYRPKSMCKLSLVKIQHDACVPLSVDVLCLLKRMFEYYSI